MDMFQWESLVAGYNGLCVAICTVHYSNRALAEHFESKVSATLQSTLLRAQNKGALNIWTLCRTAQKLKLADLLIYYYTLFTFFSILSVLAVSGERTDYPWLFMCSFSPE